MKDGKLKIEELGKVAGGCINPALVEQMKRAADAHKEALIKVTQDPDTYHYGLALCSYTQADRDFMTSIRPLSNEDWNAAKAKHDADYLAKYGSL